MGPATGNRPRRGGFAGLMPSDLWQGVRKKHHQELLSAKPNPPRSRYPLSPEVLAIMTGQNKPTTECKAVFSEESKIYVWVAH